MSKHKKTFLFDKKRSRWSKIKEYLISIGLIGFMLGFGIFLCYISWASSQH